MSAAQALKAARAAGIRLDVEGDDLVLEACAEPPPVVLDLLLQHKAGVVALLRPADDGWSAEDWLAFYDERAGMADCDERVPRMGVKTRALDCCIAQ
jgi:hypothetical protein